MTAIPCTGYGFAVSDGLLQPLGPRQRAWPSAANIDGNNGLMYDAATKKMWVSPSNYVGSIKGVRGSDGATTPIDEGEWLLGSHSLTRTASTLANEYVSVQSIDGSVSMRMGSSNHWQIRRVIVTTLNGTPTGLSSEQVNAVDNSTGGVLGARQPVVGYQEVFSLAAGDVLNVAIDYYLTVVLHTASFANQVLYRHPQMVLSYWSSAL